MNADKIRGLIVYDADNNLAIKNKMKNWNIIQLYFTERITNRNKMSLPDQNTSK